MSLHRFETRQLLSVSIDEAWAFFSAPGNLARITPPSMAFELASEVPAQVYAGLIVTYRVRPFFGIPVKWVTEITHVDPGRLFVDEQRMGPYAFWHHQHHFRPAGGGVEMRDIVHYALPFGPVGDLLNALLVRDRVRGIFEYRNSVLAAGLPGGA